jgi:hypothetical protein
MFVSSQGRGVHPSSFSAFALDGRCRTVLKLDSSVSLVNEADIRSGFNMEMVAALHNAFQEAGLPAELDTPPQRFQTLSSEETRVSIRCRDKLPCGPFGVLSL